MQPFATALRLDQRKVGSLVPIGLVIIIVRNRIQPWRQVRLTHKQRISDTDD